MSVLITADLHFSDNPRDEYRHQFVEVLQDTIRKHSVRTLLVLGDLTEKKDRHSGVLANIVASHFSELSKLCEIYVLRGNHDATDPEWPFFQFIKLFGRGNITWVNTPKSYRIKPLGDCLFLPHTSNYKSDWEGLEFGEYDFIFAHNTFKGTMSESGHELDGIPTEVFPKGSRVISGDVHNPHKVGPVTYVGAPYTVDFGDDYAARMLLISKGTGVVNLAVESLPCEDEPQKRLVIGNLVNHKAVFPKQILNQGDILKVRINLTAAQYSRWADIKAEVLSWGEKHGYVIHMVQPVAEKSAGTRKTKIMVSVTSDAEILSTYAQQRGIDEKTLRVGQRILRRSV